mgnify:FL=1
MYDTVNTEVELRGKTFDIEADVDWHIVKSECTSEVGDNPFCNESWEEVWIEDINITRVDYWTDSDQFKEIPVSCLRKKDINTIEQAVERVIESYI